MRARAIFALGIVALAGAAAPLTAQDGPDVPGTPVATPAVPLGPGNPISVIYTNLTGDPTAQVPGFPGVEFGPGIGTTHFDRVFGSPGGDWILTADTDLPTGSDEVIVVNGAVGLFEGDPAPWAGGENAGFIETKVGVNDSGDWVFATNTDGPTGADEYVVSVSGATFTAAAQEGQPVPAIAGATWGSTLESAMIASDGTVGFVSDSVGGVPTTENEVLALGAAILAQEGVDMPTGQLGAEAWDNFDINDIWISADGSSWLAQGDLTGSTTTDDVVVVDGAVVVQEGVVLAGSGFADPVDSSGIVGVHMDPGGNWYVRGNNDVSEQDWVYSNGSVLATLGDPIYAGSIESWSDAEFLDCFFLHVANSNGDFIIGGVSDGPTATNGVLVLNNTDEVVREGDPFDLDGNGMFDDDTFFDTFGNDDGWLTDGGLFYFVATIQDGTDNRIGQGLFVADLSALLGGATDLALAKSESVDPVVAGSGPGNLVYTVTLTNNGPDDATGIEVTETLTLPAGVAVDSVTPSQGTFSDPLWTVGDVAVGNSATLDVVLTVGIGAAPGVDVISDTATITAADQTLINPGDDTVTEATSIVAGVSVLEIPTLHPLGLLLLVVALGLAAVVRMRRMRGSLQLPR